MASNQLIQAYKTGKKHLEKMERLAEAASEWNQEKNSSIKSVDKLGGALAKYGIVVVNSMEDLEVVFEVHRIYHGQRKNAQILVSSEHNLSTEKKLSILRRAKKKGYQVVESVLDRLMP